MSVNTHSLARAAAFTLIELLIVITIIAILAVLGLSVTNVAMKKAKDTKCLGSVRQIGIAMRAYVVDHDGQLPSTAHAGNAVSWKESLGSYLGADFIGLCPAIGNSQATATYAWNDLLAETTGESTGEGIPAARCQTPSSTLAMAETADSYIGEHFHFAGSRSRVTYNQFKSAVAVERHGSGANYLFVDGHVEPLAATEVQTRLNATNSTFLRP